MTKTGKALAAFGLLLALGAGVAVAFVYAEPIAAYERLEGDAYLFSEAERQSAMNHRMHEAGLPLLVGTGCALLAALLCLPARRTSLGKVGAVLCVVVLAAAGSVWVTHGQKIVEAL